jgi:hypothetical protein
MKLLNFLSLSYTLTFLSSVSCAPVAQPKASISPDCDPYSQNGAVTAQSLCVIDPNTTLDNDLENEILHDLANSFSGQGS